LHLEQRPAPRPEPGHALVRPRRVGVLRCRPICQPAPRPKFPFGAFGERGLPFGSIRDLQHSNDARRSERVAACTRRSVTARRPAGDRARVFVLRVPFPAGPCAQLTSAGRFRRRPAARRENP
jgi:hypothetical protein